MRRIDEVRSKKIKDVKLVEFIDEARIRIVFPNNKEIILQALPEDYGDSASIYIEKDTI